MSTKHRFFFVLAVPLLLAMRDPFQPLQDPCEQAKLSLWRYYGVVVSQERKIGFLLDAAGGWRRVQPEMVLPEGGKILQLTEREMVIATKDGCDVTRWRWSREGLKNETRDMLAADRTVVSVIPDGKTAPGVADGR